MHWNFSKPNFTLLSLTLTITLFWWPEIELSQTISNCPIANMGNTALQLNVFLSKWLNLFFRRGTVRKIFVLSSFKFFDFIIVMTVYGQYLFLCFFSMLVYCQSVVLREHSNKLFPRNPGHLMKTSHLDWTFSMYRLSNSGSILISIL